MTNTCNYFDKYMQLGEAPPDIEEGRTLSLRSRHLGGGGGGGDPKCLERGTQWDPGTLWCTKFLFGNILSFGFKSTQGGGRDERIVTKVNF